MNKLIRLLVPGLILQGVIIGGGYATGRELVQYFLRFGLGGTALGLTLVMLIWASVFAVAFAFARATNSYDYGGFTRNLLGPARYLFDIVLITLLLLIVAVISVAAGEIAADLTGAPPIVGTLILALLIILGVGLPGRALSAIIAGWSVVLYGAYGMLAWTAAVEFSPAIRDAFATVETEPGWITSSLQYSAYNLAGLPAVLFCLRQLQGQKEALVSGSLAGIIVILPSVLLAVILAGFLPEVLNAPVPLTVVLAAIPNTHLATFVQIAILGTFWQTGVGSLHAFNDRIGAEIAPKPFPAWARGLVAAGFIVSALVLGGVFGIITLIAKGYAALTVGFLVLLIVPLFTIGARRLIQADQSLEHGAP